MKDFTYTLITDGSSDKTLMPIINWVLDQIDDVRYSGVYADLTRRASDGLYRRAADAIKIYECNILFVHRDAEAMPHQDRIAEIQAQLTSLGTPHIPVVPIRMTEAWLLLDEKAIRAAVGNPNGKVDLKLPAINRLEKLPDPKEVLFQALKQASELPPTRLAKFHPAHHRHRVAELIDDFTPLRQLRAFSQFEHDLRHEIDKL